MSDHSRIEWTEATWNPVTGCSKVSQGCKHCYALRDWPRLAAPRTPPNIYTGRAFTDVRCHPERLDQPLRWTKPRRIFVNSMSDLFHEDVPFEFIADVFAVMACTTRHTYQILTKRPERMIEFFGWLSDGDPDDITTALQAMRLRLTCFWPLQVEPVKVWPSWQPWREGKQCGYDNCGPLWPLENVWLGVSVEDQETAAARIPLLLETPAAVRWISVEPLLGPIDLLFTGKGDILYECECGGAGCDLCEGIPRLDWVVAGGESGPKARPMHPDWVRAIRDQCQAAGVPFFFKQWGEFEPVHEAAAIDEPFPAIDRVYAVNPLGAALHHSLVFDPKEWPMPAGTWWMRRIGKKIAGRILDRRTWDEYPACAQR